jgi:hypothetical protein
MENEINKLKGIKDEDDDMADADDDMADDDVGGASGESAAGGKSDNGGPSVGSDDASVDN